MKYLSVYKIIFAISTLLGTIGTHARAEEIDPRVGQIKAAIVYNIAKFVEWPPSAQPLEICMLPQDPFRSFIEAFTADKEVKGRKIKVSVVDLGKISREQKTVCQILFIGERFNDLKSKLNEILTMQGLLTICDVQSLYWGACGAQIFEDNNKARIAIDKEQLEKAGLKISSELLDLAILKPAN